MKLPARLLALATCVATALALLFWQPTHSRLAAAPEVLTAEGPLKWYRGNLHTHSLWSDGDDYLEMIALWYREHGYDFLCFTDHNVLAQNERWIDVEKSKGTRVAYDKLKAQFADGWISERTVDGRLEVRLKLFSEVAARFNDPGRFLLVQGEEISDRFQNRPVHMNASNLAEMIPPHGGESVYDVMQNNTNAVIAQRERTGQPMLVHLNHPNFGYGVTAEDLMRVRGENFFEVYNGHPGVNNPGDDTHASTERIWDIILTRRLAELDLPIMYGLATDDGHSYHKIPSRASEPGRGWVMVLASELTPATLIEALEQGRFYSSSGVTLQRVASDADGLSVAVQPEDGVTYTIDFIGTRKDFDASHSPVLSSAGEELPVTHRYSEDIGEVLATVTGPEATYRFAGDELYVRARVTSSKLHPNPSTIGEFEQAWVQPALGPATKAD